MTYMNYVANGYDSMKTKGDSRRVNELIRALLGSHSKQMTYTNNTANGYYSMKPKEIVAAKVREFVTLCISSACIHNLTQLGSKEVRFSCKEEPAVGKGRRGDTAATSLLNAA